MGAHMSGVLILIFISFPAFKRTQSSPLDAQPWWSFAGVPIYDWLLMIAGVTASLYVGFSWYGFEFNFLGLSLVVPEQVLRMGVPLPIDVFFGTVLIFVLLEAVRRTNWHNCSDHYSVIYCVRDIWAINSHSNHEASWSELVTFCQ